MIDSSGVTRAIGGTPLVELTRLLPNAKFKLYAKLEGTNPGGSSKDRPALEMICQAYEQGVIQEETVVIESSSGNMGVGLAQACRYFRLRFVCVVDINTTPQNINIMRAYGAEIDVVAEPDPQSNEFLQARLKRVKDLLERYEHSFWPNQYANEFNWRAQEAITAEIVEDLSGSVDHLFCAVGTSGTLRGCAEYCARHELGTRIHAVDAVGSVIFGYPSDRRLVPGHGAGRVPEILDVTLVDELHRVTDYDCVVGCRELVNKEAILAGGSSGGVVTALVRAAESLASGTNCVMVLSDRGERYLDTIYCNSWVERHFPEAINGS